MFADVFMLLVILARLPHGNPQSPSSWIQRENTRLEARRLIIDFVIDPQLVERNRFVHRRAVEVKVLLGRAP